MRLKTLVVAVAVFAASQAWAGEALVVSPAVKTVELVGYTRAVRSMTVTSEVSGRAERVNYDVGHTVGSKPLVEVDKAFINQAVKSAEARVVQLEVQAKRAEARALYLEKEFNRIDSLHKDDRATGVRRDASEQEMVQAHLEVDAVRAELNVARAALAELSERYRRYDIKVPRGWIVTARLVEPGEIVQPGKPLARAADFRSLVVPLAVSMEELDAIRGAKKRLTIYVEGQKVTAGLNWVNPAFDELSRKTHLELSLKDYKGRRRGGLKVIVPLSVKAEGLLVPAGAIESRYGNPRVRLASSGEVVQVMVIAESGDSVVVSSHDKRLAPGVVLLPVSSGSNDKEAGKAQ